MCDEYQTVEEEVQGLRLGLDQKENAKATSQQTSDDDKNNQED